MGNLYKTKKASTGDLKNSRFNKNSERGKPKEASSGHGRLLFCLLDSVNDCCWIDGGQNNTRSIVF